MKEHKTSWSPKESTPPKPHSYPYLQNHNPIITINPIAPNINSRVPTTLKPTVYQPHPNPEPLFLASHRCLFNYWHYNCLLNSVSDFRYGSDIEDSRAAQESAVDFWGDFIESDKVTEMLGSKIYPNVERDQTIGKNCSYAHKKKYLCIFF